jgi:hypothetical protein
MQLNNCSTSASTADTRFAVVSVEAQGVTADHVVAVKALYVYIYVCVLVDNYRLPVL